MQILAYFMWIYFVDAEIVRLSGGLFSWFFKHIFLTSIGLMVEKKATITKISSCDESIKAVSHYFQFKLSKN